jgi:heme exporter protein B
MSAFAAVLKRDLVLALRRKNEVITSVFFFVVVAALFPLGIGPEMNTLRLVGPGILWVGALLASMLSLGRMFAADYADGSLEQMALSPNSLSALVAAKILAHWLLSGLPLVLLAPVLGLQFDLSANALWILTLSLLLGTPVLSLIGAVGAALTLGVRGGDVLLALLVLPLYAGVWCRCGAGRNKRFRCLCTFVYIVGHGAGSCSLQPLGQRCRLARCT